MKQAPVCLIGGGEHLSLPTWGLSCSPVTAEKRREAINPMYSRPLPSLI